MSYGPSNPFRTRRLTKEGLEKASKSLDGMFKSFSKADFEVKKLLIELITIIKEEKQDQLFDKIKSKQSLQKFIKHYKNLYPLRAKETVTKMINDKTLPKPDLSNYNG